MPSSEAPATPSARRTMFQTMVDDPRGERARLSRLLADIEEELADYGVRAAVAARPARLATTAKPAGSRRAKPARTKAKRAPRGANQKSLKNSILDVLGAEGIGVADIVRAVLEGGYKTRAVALDKSVAVVRGALTKAKAVKRTGRRLYVAAGVKG